MKLKTKSRTLLSLTLFAAVIAIAFSFAVLTKGFTASAKTNCIPMESEASLCVDEITSPVLYATTYSEMHILKDAELSFDKASASEVLPNDALTGANLPDSAENSAADNSQTTVDNSENGTSESPTLSAESATSPKVQANNVFEQIYDFATEYLGDIFSILAFIAGLATAILYKRGLVPGISKVGSALKASVDTAVKDSEKLIQDSAEAHEIADGKLDLLTERLGNLSSEIEMMKTQLDLTGALEERAKLQGVLMMEIELLYTIFTASAMPQYMKDELNNRIKQMKKELLNDEQVA